MCKFRKATTIFAAWTVTISLLMPNLAVAQGATVESAYAQFQLGRYKEVYAALMPYRQTNGGTFRVDFMLGVSACQLGGLYRVWGREMLRSLSSDYAPISAANALDISRRIESCEVTIIATPDPRRIIGSAGVTSVAGTLATGHVMGDR